MNGAQAARRAASIGRLERPAITGVLVREVVNFSSYWRSASFSSTVEPTIYLLAFGFGFGALSRDEQAAVRALEPAIAACRVFDQLRLERLLAVRAGDRERLGVCRFLHRGQAISEDIGSGGTPRPTGR